MKKVKMKNGRESENKESEEINTSKKKNKINKVKIKENEKNYIIKIIDLNDKDENSSVVTK